MTSIDKNLNAGSAKLLVIDDDDVTRTMLVKVLANSGYEVEEASSGELGFEKLITFQPELVLLDVVMPGIDGFETCEKIRKITPYNETPVLMLTGLNDEASVDNAFDVGANDFITKPINWSLLVKRVKYLLRDRLISIHLVENEARLRLSQRIAKISDWEMNSNSLKITISDSFGERTGSSVDSIHDLNDFLGIIHEDDREIVANKISKILEDGESYQVDHRMVCGQERECIFQQNGEAVLGKSGEISHIIGTLQDITQQKHAESLIEYQKNYDELTDLPNKNYFYTKLNSYLDNNDFDNMLAVIHIGADRFTAINESLGYKAGDTLLKEFGARIKDVILGHGFLARYSGDTFSLTVNKLKTIDEIETLLEQIQTSLLKPYFLNDEEVYSTSSIGITIYPMDEGRPDKLVANAEFAMRQAKEQGGSRYNYYSPDMNETAVRKREVEKYVRYALENNGFKLLYQPQINLQEDKVIGAEALLRLFTKEGEMISPVDFIPIAEETGLIVPLGYWIIETACAQIRTWIDDGITGIRYGINLSARQFRDENLERKLNEYVSRYHLPAEVIDLEITESIAMDDMSETLKILKKFKDNGYTISMDDFGTGHSSLSYLKQLPIDIIKVDRAFIKDINAAGEHGEIAKTVIDMAHNLNMNVIAEGAEEIEHINFLVENGCDEVQGFYYSKPLSVDKFSEYIINYKGNLKSA